MEQTSCTEDCRTYLCPAGGQVKCLEHPTSPVCCQDPWCPANLKVTITTATGEHLVHVPQEVLAGWRRRGLI